MHTENWQANKSRRETGRALIYKPGQGCQGYREAPSEIAVVIHSSPELKMAPWEFTGTTSGSRKEQIQDKVKLGAGCVCTCVCGGGGGRDRTG